jgi:endo-1,4-beta-xylanase
MTNPRRALLTALTLLAGAVTATAQNTTATNATREEDGLHSLMVKAGKMYFGTATDISNFNDTAYQAIVSNKNMFGMITAENSMKWAAIQTSPDKYSYADADRVVAKAKANGQQMRCHTLVYTQLPSFGNYPPYIAR